MIEPGPGIPPAIALLLNEEFSLLDPIGARRKLRGMLRELREQSLASVRDGVFLLPEPDSNPLNFRVFADAGLDLLGHSGACLALPCRLSYADKVARSVAVMADDVWFTDYITERIFDVGRPTNAKLDLLLDDVYVLQRLRPLVVAGIARFRSPLRPVCDGCLSAFEQQVDEVTEHVLEEFRSQLRIERRASGRMVVHTGSMYEPSMVLQVIKEIPKKDDKRLLFSVVQRSVRHALWTAGDAAFGGGAVFSNSKAGLSGLLSEEGAKFSKAGLAALEGHRAGELPWIDGLSVEQTVQLREEASQALPRLREFLARHLAARPHHDDRSPVKPRDYVAELREQAADVRAELTNVSRGRRSIARSSLGVLGLGIFAYGFASGSLEATTGLFQLLSTLGLLHQLGAPETQHAESLKSKPGYVLVAAQSLLAHANAK